jgi:predicted transcriptional regulator of viral defense system
MEHLGERYYAGLLSAAEYHGAGHQRPQIFQVVVAKNKPGITCGHVRVEFIARKNMKMVPTADFKTPRGYLKVSTPAATAFDLVGYPYHAGGPDNVATILAELGEKLDGKELVGIAKISPIAWAQRLGYLLEMVGHRAKTEGLAAYIGRKNPVPTPLVPSRPFGGVAQAKPWRILVNAKVEAEA